MKILLSPTDNANLEIAKNILYLIYAGQLAVNNEVLNNQELFNAVTTIDNVMREYNLTLNGIKEDN